MTWSRILVTAVLTLGTAVVPASAATPAAAANNYTIGSLSVEVGTAPFSLTFTKNGQLLGRAVNGATAARGALHFKSGDTWYGATDLKSVDQTASALTITATTAGSAVSLVLTPVGTDRVTTVVQGPAGSTDAGLTMSIADGGHWYGGGETKTQPWPMDNGGSFDFTAPWPNDATFWFADKGGNRPYATSDNGWDVQTPLWYTSQGFGLFVNTYDWLDFAFNAAKDGLFVLGNPHGAGLTATMYVEQDARAVFNDFQNDLGPRSPLPAAATVMLAKPIWTTWAEFKQGISQDVVLQYARDIVSNGVGHGIMEIDDKWNAPAVRGQGLSWGEMEFDSTRFPDPKAMVGELHAAGFLVTLWIPPFIDLDTTSGAEAVQNGYCVKRPQGTPYLVKWWDNFYSGSCLLDYSNPAAGEWWAAKLKSLQTRYGIDGFKFDGGEANFMPKDAVTFGNIKANQYADVNMKWAADKGFDIHEMRSAWLGQTQGRIVREFDKDTKWGFDNGMQSVVSQALALSAIGYAYTMPDMIGGNQYSGDLQDKDLMARWVELSSFMEMMQFSIRPWTTTQHPSFDDQTASIARRYSHVFEALLPYRQQLVARTHDTGVPVIEPLFFEHPHDTTAQQVNDEWLLGPDLLAAPVVTKGAVTRDVYLPAGQWRSLWGDGDIIAGPVTLHDVAAPLDRAPAYYRTDGAYRALLGGIAVELAGTHPVVPEVPLAESAGRSRDVLAATGEAGVAPVCALIALAAAGLLRRRRWSNAQAG